MADLTPEEIVTSLERRGFSVNNITRDFDDDEVFFLSRRRKGTTRVAQVEGTLVNGMSYADYITTL